MTRKGSIGSTTIRLARGTETADAYQRRYIPVDPQGFVSNEEGRPGVAADDQTRVWAIRSWRGGEGENVWRRDSRTYRRSTDVRPVTVGDGLQLGARAEITEKSSSTFNDGGVMGRALGNLYTGVDEFVYPWDTATEEWGTAIGVQGSSTIAVTSLADGADTFIYVGREDNSVRRFNSSTNEIWISVGSGIFSSPPIVGNKNGTVYATGGADVLEVDKGTANTTTKRLDSSGSSSAYLDDDPFSYNIMTEGDAGPILVRRLNTGRTPIWEYDEAADVQREIGSLPVDFGFPYSVAAHHGFVFVGFRWASAHDQSGDAHIYFQRGAQRGVTDPIRAPSGTTASKPVLIAGTVGDDLVFYFDGVVWAYNLSDGGVYQVAGSGADGTADVWQAITFGKDVFVAPVTSGTNTAAVERFVTTDYASTGTIDSGRFDFDYPGLDKILLDVTVVTDPLPANTSVSMSVSVDGGSFTSLTGTHDTDDATKFTWSASDNSSSLRGKLFELRTTLASSTSTSTPTVREISARATGADHRIEWILQVDAGDVDGQSSKDLISALRSLANNSVVVQLTDPWQNAEGDPETFDVTVEEVILPKVRDAESTAESVATLRLRSRSLV